MQKLRNLTTIWHELLCGEMSLLPQYCQSTKGQLRTVAKIILILFKNPYWSKSLDFVQKIGQSALVLMMFRQKIGQLMNELKLHCQCFHHKNYGDWKLQGPCRENLHYLWKRAVRIAGKPRNCQITKPLTRNKHLSLLYFCYSPFP